VQELGHQLQQAKAVRLEGMLANLLNQRCVSAFLLSLEVRFSGLAALNDIDLEQNCLLNGFDKTQAHRDARVLFYR
jgi:hypothetical protein